MLVHFVKMRSDSDLVEARYLLHEIEGREVIRPVVHRSLLGILELRPCLDDRRLSNRRSMTSSVLRRSMRSKLFFLPQLRHALLGLRCMNVSILGYH